VVVDQALFRDAGEQVRHAVSTPLASGPP